MKPKVFLLIFLFFIIFCAPSVKASDIYPISYQVTVSASIGEPKLTIFGYTSPKALVQLEGNRVSDSVISDTEGYFFFDRIFLPRPNPNYPELCLNSIDTQSRTAFPNCLAPLPVGPFDITIGPVLLSPTISLEKGYFLPGQQIVSSGSTLPNSEVTIYFYNNESPTKRARSPISEVWAYSLPKYQVRSDSNGHFEFSLPTSRIANWRLFASAQYQTSPTPKSNTLNFKVLSWWGWLVKKITEVGAFILGLFRPYLWLIIILAELITLIMILWQKRKQKLAERNFDSLRQYSIPDPGFNQIIGRGSGRDIKNRPA